MESQLKFAVSFNFYPLKPWEGMRSLNPYTYLCLIMYVSLFIYLWLHLTLKIVKFFTIKNSTVLLRKTQQTTVNTKFLMEKTTLRTWRGSPNGTMIPLWIFGRIKIRRATWSTGLTLQYMRHSWTYTKIYIFSTRIFVGEWMCIRLIWKVSEIQWFFKI